MSRRPTMKDVALAAGVSQPTVSFVLNGQDVGLAESTRRRVLQVAAELDYRPNRTAQALRRQSPYAIGVITNGIATTPYAGAILQGVQQAARDSDCVCMVIDIAHDSAAGEEGIRTLLDSGVVGIIYASPGLQPFDVPARSSQTRNIFVNCWPRHPDETKAEAVITPDEVGGGLAAGRALFGAGHTAVAYLGGQVADRATAERRDGFLAAAREHGVDPASVLQLYGEYSMASGYRLSSALWDQTPAADRPTALFCGCDRMALGALLALQERGLSCPDDVSLVGYDDQPELAPELHPALTTVALPFYAMGLMAGRMLTQPAQPRTDEVQFDCPIVWRESLRPPLFSSP